MINIISNEFGLQYTPTAALATCHHHSPARLNSARRPLNHHAPSWTWLQTAPLPHLYQYPHPESPHSPTPSAAQFANQQPASSHSHLSSHPHRIIHAPPTSSAIPLGSRADRHQAPDTQTDAAMSYSPHLMSFPPLTTPFSLLDSPYAHPTHQHPPSNFPTHHSHHQFLAHPDAHPPTDLWANNIGTMAPSPSLPNLHDANQ
ncbi:hypothetical protein EVG20_g8529, partial [Dentipellis fragilis]